MPIQFTLQCDTAEELRAALGVLAPNRLDIQWRKFEPEAVERSVASAASAEAPVEVDALTEALTADAPIGDGIEHAPVVEDAKPARRTRKPKETTPAAEEPAAEQPTEDAPVSDLMDDAEAPAAEPETATRSVSLDDLKAAMIRATMARVAPPPHEMTAYFKANFGGAGALSSLDPKYYEQALAYLVGLLNAGAKTDG
jgi:hypothetical protein